MRRIVCRAEELPTGARTLVEVGGRSIGVFNVDGRLYALRNACPHHGAPLCAGPVTGRMLPSEPQVYQYGDHHSVVRCPWHGYEFRLADGRSPLPGRRHLRAKTYRVEVEDGDVVLYV